MKISKILENKYFEYEKGQRELNAKLGYRLISVIFEGLESEDDNSCLYLDFEIFCRNKGIDIYWYDGSNNFDEDKKMYDFQIEVDEEQLKEFNQVFKEFKKNIKIYK